MNDDHEVWYHGVGPKAREHIREHGLSTPSHVSPASWFMLTDSHEQAEGYAGAGGSVLEYHIPKHLTNHRQNKDSVLWPPKPHSSYGVDARAVAPRGTIGNEHLVAEHPVSSRQAALRRAAGLSFEHVPVDTSEWKGGRIFADHPDGKPAGMVEYHHTPAGVRYHEPRDRGVPEHGAAMVQELLRHHPDAQPKTVKQPEPERDHEGPWFHGTTVPNLKHVRPAGPRGKVTFPSDTSREHAYATGTESAAWTYAEKAYNNSDSGAPRVYEVHPTGPIERDPVVDERGNIRGGVHEHDYRSKHRWKVIREVPMPKEMGKHEDWDPSLRKKAADDGPEKDAHRLQYGHQEWETGGSKYPNKERIFAQHPEHGQVGNLTYLRGNRPNSPILIDRLEVPEEHQRKGYGSALMDQLQQRYPKAKINHGDRTDQGKAWWSQYGKGADSRGRTSALARRGTIHVAVEHTMMPLHQVMRLSSGDYPGELVHATRPLMRDEWEESDESAKWRRHGGPDRYIEHVKKDVAAHGIREPLTVTHYGEDTWDEDEHPTPHVLTDGHTRAWAAHGLGMSEVPVRHVYAQPGRKSSVLATGGMIRAAVIPPEERCPACGGIGDEPGSSGSECMPCDGSGRKTAGGVQTSWDHVHHDPSTWSESYRGYAQQKPHGAAVGQAQEHARDHIPTMNVDLGSTEDATGAMKHMMGRGGHPKADDSFVMKHSNPEWGQSQAFHSEGEPGVAIHPDRWDYGTLAHEVAHHLHENELGYHPKSDEEAHGPDFARHYQNVLSSFGRDTGGVFEDAYHEALGRVRKHAAAPARQERVDHITRNFAFADGDSWPEVRENYVPSAPPMRRMREDIRQNGIHTPIPIDYDQSPPKVLDGHTRLFHAEGLGMKHVPVRHVTEDDHSWEQIENDLHHHGAAPTQRLFGPTYGLDRRLFDGDQLKADVTHYVMSTLDGFWRPLYGAGWQRWARVYLAGSEASEWTSPTLEGNNDFDILIGVHYDRARADVRVFRGLSDAEITDELNGGFRADLMPRTQPVWILVQHLDSGSWQNAGASPPALPRSTTSWSGSTSRRSGPPQPSLDTSVSAMPASSATTWSGAASPEISRGARREEHLPLAQSAAIAPSPWTSPAPTSRVVARVQGDARSAGRRSVGTGTSVTAMGSPRSASTRSLRNRAADAPGAEGQTSSLWSTTTTGAARDSGRAAGAFAASSALGTTRPLDSSERTIWAPQSLGWTAASPPPAPDGYTWVGPLDSTFYCNPGSWNIIDIKPYAAYDITNHSWAVRPPHLPDWDVSKFPEGHALVEMGEAYEQLIAAIFALPEPYRTQQGNALWTYLHTDRSRAFGPEGEGWYDPGNVMEKWLDQQGVWADLWAIHHRAEEDPFTLLAPANWSNDPASMVNK